MIIMNVIGSDKWLKILEDLYETDEELCDLYHIEAPATSKVCASRTFDDIKNLDDFCFYILIKEGRISGWFGKEQDHLTGFFLDKGLRKNSKDVFKSYIFPKFEDGFLSSVYKKNSRAVSFLKKIGEPYAENNVIFTVKISK